MLMSKAFESLLQEIDCNIELKNTLPIRTQCVMVFDVSKCSVRSKEILEEKGLFVLENHATLFVRKD